MSTKIKSGNQWFDTDGKLIQAHGGGILYQEGIYYWYGENKTGNTCTIPCFREKWKPEHTKEKKEYNHYLELVGVSCYSSIDLVNWKNEGVVLKAEKDDYTSDIYYHNILERPKVIYNKKTKKYVMWMHIDVYGYQYAKAGIAISDNPTGPFEYIRSIAPNGEMARDMTVFVDDDEQAYLFCSAEENQTMHIHLLTADYLDVTTTYTKIFPGEAREAPAVVKKNGNYFIMTSACTGWAPNKASYAVSNNVMGPYETKGDPTIDDTNETTFESQSTYILTIAGKNQLIYMGDRWLPNSLYDSRYIWLPMTIEDEEVRLEWVDEWSIEKLK